MFDPFSIFYFFTFLLFQIILFKALFKPAGAFLTVQRYSIFHKEPNLLNYFKRKWSLFLRRARPAGSQPPNPPSPKEGFRPLPKPLANLWQGAKLITTTGRLHQSFGMALEPLPLRGSPCCSSTTLNACRS